LQARLQAWVTARIAAKLGPLLALRDAAEAKTGEQSALIGQARGIAHQLAENFAAWTAPAGAAGKAGSAGAALAPFGVWFGRRTVYLPKLLRPDAAALLTLLWGVWTRKGSAACPARAGLTSFAVDKGWTPRASCRRFCGSGGRAIRFDMLERLEDELEQALSAAPMPRTLLTKLVSLLGSSKEEARRCWRSGLAHVDGADAKPVWRRQGKAAPQEKAHKPSRRPIPIHHSRAWLRYASDEPSRQMAVPRPLLSHAALAQAATRRPSPAQWREGRQARPCAEAGDVLTLGKGGQVIAVRVLALAERRGPARKRKALYEVWIS
jgi:ATP-dependent RNA helicase SUPV3L1/SUV3